MSINEFNSVSLSFELNNNGFGLTSTINYNNIKKDLVLEELYKNKKIIMPYKKEINNINININGYNIHGGSLTSRSSKNAIKKKRNKKNNIKEMNFHNNCNKIISNKNKQNNLIK